MLSQRYEEKNKFSHQEEAESHTDLIKRVRKALEIDLSSDERFAASIPFSDNDATCGCENEFQAVVMGSSYDVDLPITIRDSSCYKNILKRNKRDGENYRKIIGFEQYLNPSFKKGAGELLSDGDKFSDSEQKEFNDVWENSWVRFPKERLNLYANQILDRDLYFDKQNPSLGYRKDINSFFVKKDGVEYLRIPVSYLLKIALANAVGNPSAHSALRATAKKMMSCYINDNSSPEILSFFPSPLKIAARREISAVRETAIRFLLIQLLTAYANMRFRLIENGQRAMVYFASHTPQRQKQFNTTIPDAFYRELFMSPCLSGWDQGEYKMGYMHICHRVLSRSRLNAVSKLKDAGIITSNLVVLPNISDVSLANNGTHISIGSKKISQLLRDESPYFTNRDEKYLGDLSIKICEHFLPLFVGTYSATPYRLDFEDFHPEKILGFLPHELDFTHLRMLWKEWKKKAGLKIFSQPITPFGPESIDQFISKIFSLKGDIVPDFRLIDYFAAVMSTDENSALNGKEGNEKGLAMDLQDMGIFDARMSLYMLLRLRKNSIHGFSGIEARYYSTFESLFADLGDGIQIQRLIMMLAWKLILEEKITHEDIPDTPEVESERRQIFFGAAIGIKSVFIKEDTPNKFLQNILSIIQKRAKLTRSIKYSGYYKLKIKDYLIALLQMLEQEGAILVNSPELSRCIKNLKKRIESPSGTQVYDRMVAEIMKKEGGKKPMDMRAEEFNQACERYLRDDLRKKHITEGVRILEEDIQVLDLWASFRDPACKAVLFSIIGDESAADFLSKHKQQIIDETAEEDVLEKMIQLIVLTIERNIESLAETI
ncbi:MAG: hypothetical protein HQK68_11645 [Desulfamplus sp.]|nr:hypothetical protein [Desulfamplus sp.]